MSAPRALVLRGRAVPPAGRAGAAAAVIVTTALLAAACRVPPPAQPVVPADVIVLVADPESTTIGRAVVTAAGRSVNLASEHEATRVRPGQAPTTPTVMPDDEVRRLFDAALVARPPQPLEFLLYFETGSDTLTPASQAELTRTVDVIRNRAVPDVSVVGHTDTTGDAASNATLGLQRATLIRNQLVAAGVPAAQIEATSHGEADLLVPTADNVAEARNRRVEITVR
jgi:OOP family OmpA-OmpF porin